MTDPVTGDLDDPGSSVVLYEVGGCVRDDLLGIPSKDIDYAVEIPDLLNEPVEHGYEAMRAYLIREGFTIFLETPEFLTIRAQFPRTPGQRRSQTADFVLARRDGAYSDGRRPDEVFVGTLADDLARRDFTVNALARTTDGTIIDHHDGMRDLDARVLRCVGITRERMNEDALRALRAVRFAICKGFTFDADLAGYLSSAQCRLQLSNVSIERKREELHRAFAHDTIATLDLLHTIHPRFAAAALDGMWLRPTQEKP